MILKKKKKMLFFDNIVFYEDVKICNVEVTVLNSEMIHNLIIFIVDYQYFLLFKYLIHLKMLTLSNNKFSAR